MSGKNGPAEVVEAFFALFAFIALYNGPQNLNQLLRDIETAKAKFRFIPKKEVHEKKLQWEV
jgi:hypothetical protein